MSVRATIWAWGVGGMTATTKLVLLSLASRTLDDGHDCAPAIRAIAAECCLSDRAVQAALRWLEAEGYITTVQRVRQTNQFILRLGGKVGAP